MDSRLISNLWGNINVTSLIISTCKATRCCITIAIACSNREILLERRFCGKRRQSDLKSGGSWIRVRNVEILIFQVIWQTKNQFLRSNFREISIFHVISQKVSIFQGKFPKNFDFFGHFIIVSIFQAQICYLQLFL